MNRSTFVRAGAAGGLMAAAGGRANAAPVRKPAGWDALVAAATKEGSVTLYGPPTDPLYAALITRFQKAFPGIRVDSTIAFGSQLETRIMAERAAGRYLCDVYINGSTAALLGLKPGHAIDPLTPLIVLPEILDRSAWLENQLWFNDAAAPYENLTFAAVMFPPAYINTTLAKVSDFTSYWDLADQKWKGKVVSNDIRIPGPGGVPARFIYKDPRLGQPWFDRFFGGLNVPLGRDQRQLVDWLATGKYAVAAFIDTDEAQAAINQGLPIAPISLGQLKEGGAIAPGAGAVSIVNNAPHPNAAKLYLNWLLSRDGQIAWQEETKLASLRIDIPKPSSLYLNPPLLSHVHFVNGGSEAYSQITGKDFEQMIGDILKKLGRS